jgi:hypothetical protein
VIDTARYDRELGRFDRLEVRVGRAGGMRFEGMLAGDSVAYFDWDQIETVYIPLEAE